MLAPDGIIVFSTLNLAALDSSPDVKGTAVESEPGFYFSPRNETLGRLPSSLYGLTYVSEGFVRGLIASEGVGTLVRSCPGKLFGGWQDAYVVSR